VSGLEVDDDGKVRFQFMLRADDPGLRSFARRAVRGRPSTASPRSRSTSSCRARRSRSMRPARPGLSPARFPRRRRTSRSRNIGHVIAVSSGKGGVGKSTVAANLAAALAAAATRSACSTPTSTDPDMPLMFGEKRKPKVTGTKGSEKIVPLEAHGVKLMSLGFLLEEEQPAIMRGPLVSGILKQFLEQVEWGELDYLIIDMPPGTGDAQLSLVQTVDLDGAVLVTTPQEVSTSDVRRASACSSASAPACSVSSRT
jgi:ATP-binding protein involved in chromosome partitioning